MSVTCPSELLSVIKSKSYGRTDVLLILSSIAINQECDYCVHTQVVVVGLVQHLVITGE